MRSIALNFFHICISVLILWCERDGVGLALPLQNPELLFSHWRHSLKTAVVTLLRSYCARKTNIQTNMLLIES